MRYTLTSSWFSCLHVWRMIGLLMQSRTQIGMFRPIRMDHTNCLQVAIKTLQFNSRVKSIQGFYSESERDDLIADTFLLGWSLCKTFTQNLRETDLQWIRYIALESTRGEMPLRVIFTAFYNCSGPRGLIMFVLFPMHLRKHAGAQWCSIVKVFMLFMLLCM